MQGSARLAQFLTDHAPQGVFERRLVALDVVAQGRVDEALVVPAPGSIHLITIPINDVGIQPDGDAGLERRGGQDRAALAFAEVVALFHGLFLVLAEFVGLGGAGRNKTYSLRLPLGVDHHHQPSEGINAKCNETLFVVVAVLDRDSARIIEHAHRVGEFDAMLAQVGFPLGLVPFELYALSVCTISVHVHIGVLMTAGCERRSKIAVVGWSFPSD
jgi:hypothetical protein